MLPCINKVFIIIIVISVLFQNMLEHPSGSTWPAEILLFQFEIVKHVISESIPLSKVDILCPLLEKYGYRLTHSACLCEIIPGVLEKEETLQ